MEPSGEGMAPRGAFTFDHLMVDIKGRLAPRLSYRYLQRFNKAAKIYPLEHLSNAIDYAYLRYDFSPSFGLIVGRQVLSVGGFEYDEFPIDIYDFSWIGDRVSPYLNGVTSVFQLSPSQQVTFQVVNNRTLPMEEAFGTSDLEAFRYPFYLSLGWNSSYFDHLLQLRYAGSYGPLAKGVNGLILGAGQKLNLRTLELYFDLLYYGSGVDYLGLFRHYLPSDLSQLKQTEYLSAILDFRYHIDKWWNVHFKGVLDYGVAKMGGTGRLDQYLERQVYQVSLQYHPLEGKHFYFYLNGSYYDYRGLLSKPTLSLSGDYRASLGLVARLSLFQYRW